MKKIFNKQKIEGLTYLEDIDHCLEYYGFHDVKINKESIVFYYNNTHNLNELNFLAVSYHVIRLAKRFFIDVPKISFVMRDE